MLFFILQLQTSLDWSLLYLFDSLSTSLGFCLPVKSIRNAGFLRLYNAKPDFVLHFSVHSIDNPASCVPSRICSKIFFHHWIFPPRLIYCHIDGQPPPFPVQTCGKDRSKYSRNPTRCISLAILTNDGILLQRHIVNHQPYHLLLLLLELGKHMTQ